MKRLMIGLIGLILWMHMMPVHAENAMEVDPIVEAYRACMEALATEDYRVFAKQGDEYIVYSAWQYKAEEEDRYYYAFEFAAIYPGMRAFHESHYVLVEAVNGVGRVKPDSDALNQQALYQINLSEFSEDMGIVMARERASSDNMDIQKQQQIQQAADYLDEMYGFTKYIVDGVPHKRTAYYFTCRDNPLLAEYEKYECVIVIDYIRSMGAYQQLPAIEQEAVGMLPDGSFEICRTPEKVRSRAFSQTLFDDVEIEYFIYQ